MGKELKWIEPEKLLIDTPNPRAYITNLTVGAPQGAKSTETLEEMELRHEQERKDYIAVIHRVDEKPNAPTRTTEEVREAPEDNEQRSSS